MMVITSRPAAEPVSSDLPPKSTPLRALEELQQFAEVLDAAREPVHLATMTASTSRSRPAREAVHARAVQILGGFPAIDDDLI